MGTEIFLTRGGQNEDATFMARIEVDGDFAVSADCDKIEVVITAPTGKVTATVLTVADVLFDVLYTGGGWDQDPIGWNFQDTRLGANFPAAGVYEVEYWFRETGADDYGFRVKFQHTVLDSSGPGGGA